MMNTTIDFIGVDDLLMQVEEDKVYETACTNFDAQGALVRAILVERNNPDFVSLHLPSIRIPVCSETTQGGQ